MDSLCALFRRRARLTESFGEGGGSFLLGCGKGGGEGRQSVSITKTKNGDRSRNVNRRTWGDCLATDE